MNFLAKMAVLKIFWLFLIKSGHPAPEEEPSYTETSYDLPSSPEPDTENVNKQLKKKKRKDEFKSENSDEEEISGSECKQTAVKVDLDDDMYQVIGTKVGTLRFKCSVCSHKSRYKQGIIDHVKQVHRKERPYQCPQCHRSFFRKTGTWPMSSLHKCH